VRVALVLEQRAPARISRCLSAIAGALVEIGTTCRAESLAILSALDERGRRQQPGFPNRRSKIDVPFAWIIKENVRIIGFVGAVLGEEEVYILFDLNVDVLEAKPAGHVYPAFNAAAEIEPAISGGRESTGQPDGFGRTNVRIFPNGIVGRERAVDVDGFGLQRAEVKGQHKPFKLAGLCVAF
jgi:hypothetical protein